MLKQQCQQIMEEVSTLFLKRKHSIYKILLMYSKYIDRLLCQYFPKTLVNISLIAVGGYGRQDRALYSDLDLVFLARSERELAHPELSKFIQELQTLTLKVGYVAHTLLSIFEHAQSDLNLLTAILDARLVCGNISLFEEFKELVKNKTTLPSIETFILAKYSEQLGRDERFPINQQPDLKNTVGNLRYLQSIHWLLIYLHPNVHPSYLVKHQYITQHEFESLGKAHRLLSAIRFYLHILYQREQNALLVDKQLTLAHFFGFWHKKNNKSIELFMQNYYNSIRHVKLINRIIFHELLSRYALKPTLSIDSDFSICSGVLNHRLANYPQKLNQLVTPFIRFCQSDKANTLSANILRNTTALLSNLGKKNLLLHNEIQLQFLSLFSQAYNIKGALSIMMDLGLIEKIIPEFAGSKGQMQFDLYHQYTVDRHTIKVIDILYYMQSEAFKSEFSLAASIMQTHPAKRLLYIAAFFHDIGKGSGVDHCKFGARVVQKYAEIWSLKQDEIHLLTWLVKHHLAFSRTIKKEDIYDVTVVRQLVEFCQSQYYLDSLFLLTIADIKGTNPKLWTPWQQTMFENLYKHTSDCLVQSHKLTIKEQVMQTQTRLLDKLDGADHTPILSLWQTLPARYFSEQPFSTLAWQSAILQELSLSKIRSPEIYVCFDNILQQSQLLIFAPLATVKLSSVCYVLYKADINITDAGFFILPQRIMLYQFSITDVNHNALQSEQKLNWVKLHLQTELMQGKTVDAEHKFTTPAHHKMMPKRMKNSVQLLSPRHKNYTQITVKCPDRPGLLAALCYFLELNQLNIIRARIHTAGPSVEDTFYITDNNDEPIIKQSRMQLLEHRFLKYLKA